MILFDPILCSSLAAFVLQTSRASTVCHHPVHHLELCVHSPSSALMKFLVHPVERSQFNRISKLVDISPLFCTSPSSCVTPAQGLMQGVQLRGPLCQIINLVHSLFKSKPIQVYFITGIAFVQVIIVYIPSNRASCCSFSFEIITKV